MCMLQAHVCLVYVQCHMSVNNHEKDANLKYRRGQMKKGCLRLAGGITAQIEGETQLEMEKWGRKAKE